MNLKVVMTPLHLLFNVAFHVDNKFCLENIHILANMTPKISIKFVTIWVVARRDRVKANGEGVKNRW